MTIFRGIAFPLQSSSTEFPASSSDAALIKQSLVQIVMTGEGERVMRPEFGTRALALVFEPLDEDLRSKVQHTLAVAIGKYEPRVRVSSIQVSREDTQVLVAVEYVILANGAQDRVQLTLGSP